MKKEEIIALLIKNLYAIRQLRPKTGGGGLSCDFVITENWNTIKKLDPTRYRIELENWARMDYD